MVDKDSVEDVPGGESFRRVERSRSGGRGLNSQAQKRLGVHLRAMYESVVQQPIPDRFTNLIARLDDDEQAVENDVKQVR